MGLELPKHRCHHVLFQFELVLAAGVYQGAYGGATTDGAKEDGLVW